MDTTTITQKHSFFFGWQLYLQYSFFSSLSLSPNFHSWDLFENYLCFVLASLFVAVSHHRLQQQQQQQQKEQQGILLSLSFISKNVNNNILPTLSKSKERKRESEKKSLFFWGK
jgi:hypothetical protein